MGSEHMLCIPSAPARRPHWPQVPVSAGGTILGTDLAKVKAGGDGVGLRMYDPGYVNTAAVKSKICFIDGNKGILRYRGYPIEQVRHLTHSLRTPCWHCP